MAKCPICKNKEAEKKNVHLISWFLIKKTITQEGSGARDMEISFTIDPERFTRIYAGRSVLPEKIEEFGNLNEFQKEIDNPYSRDNLICESCEANLSRLEAIFASQFSERKLDIAFQAKQDILNDNVILTDQNYNYSLFELFVQSLFYRCSIGSFDGFTLNPKIQEKIEENLRSAFALPNFKKINSQTQIDLKHHFPLISTYFFEAEAKDPTSHYILIPKSRFPYCLMAGKWTFQLFEEEKHLKSTIQWLYGLKDGLNAVDAVGRTKNKSHIFVLNDLLSAKIVDNVKEDFAEKKIVGLRKNIRVLHETIFGHKPSPFISDYIYKQYFDHLKEGKTEHDALIFAFMDLKKLP